MTAPAARLAEHGPVDLEWAGMTIATAKGYAIPDADPQAWIAVALRDAEDMAAELALARPVVEAARQLGGRGGFLLVGRVAAYDHATKHAPTD